MILAGVLLFVGLLLVFLEFYLPGGIMGVAGGVALIAAVVLFALKSPHPLLSVGFAIFAFVLLGLLVKMTLHRIQRSHGDSSIYLGTDQAGSKGAEYEASMIGKEGIAATDLRPSGYIVVEGKRYQAVSRMGYLPKGERIEVVAGEGGHLVVKHIREEEK